MYRFARELSSAFSQWSGRRQGDILVIRSWRVAYARVPKAANSSVKLALARGLGLPRKGPHKTARDAYWREIDPANIKFVSCKDFATSGEYKDYFCFGVVRDPVARLVSCYKNKIVRNGRMSRSLRRNGFRLGMGFDDFVRLVAKTPDDKCDIHIRSQSSMLCHEGQVLPDVVVDINALKASWTKIATPIKERTGVSLVLPPTKNSTADVKVEIELTPELEGLIRVRYVRDYELIFNR